MPRLNNLRANPESPRPLGDLDGCEIEIIGWRESEPMVGAYSHRRGAVPLLVLRKRSAIAGPDRPRAWDSLGAELLQAPRPLATEIKNLLMGMIRLEEPRLEPIEFRARTEFRLGDDVEGIICTVRKDGSSVQLD